MTPTITATHGDRDGIRWGDVHFAPGDNRRWTHDLLTGQVRLYRHPASGDYGGDCKFVEDRRPERVEAVRRALTS